MLLQSLTDLEKAKKNIYIYIYIRSGQLESAYHSPLTCIKLDMTETVTAEFSQSVHHFTQQ